MNSLPLSNASKILETCLDDSEFVLTQGQLETSQLIRNFCAQAIEFAPICGMVMGQIASPILRLHTARLFTPLLGKTASHVGSWICAMSGEGFLMAATPTLIHEKRLGLDVWRGTVHGTLTMMVCGGIARIPLGGGLLAACGQDLGLMLVNWGCGELTITEKVQGGFIAQYVEARVSSMRIACSAGMVRATCVEVSMMKARYELNHQLESGSGSGIRGWGFKKVLPSFSFEQEFAANNGMRVKEVFNEGPSKEAAAQESMVFMSRKDEAATGRREETDTARSLSAKNEEGASSQSNAENMRPLWDKFEALHRSDPFLAQAYIKAFQELEVPEMITYRPELEAILEDVQLTSEKKYHALSKRADEILIENSSLREGWQKLQPKISLSRKLLYLVPNGVTLFGVGCGAHSMLLASEGHFKQAALWLLLAAIADGSDGKIARATKTQSEIGGNLDTAGDTADYPVFGGFFAYKVLHSLGEPVLGTIAGGIILFNGITRLAVFEYLRRNKKNIPAKDIIGKEYTDGDAFWGSASTTVALVLPPAYVVYGNNPEAFYAISAGVGVSMMLPIIFRKIGGGAKEWVKKHWATSTTAGTAALASVFATFAYQDPIYVSKAGLIGLGIYWASNFVPSSKKSSEIKSVKKKKPK